MPSSSKLSNMSEALHNLPDDYEMYRLNYLFMAQSPMYTALEQKYRDLRKKCREQKRMIEFLNKQHMELAERYAAAARFPVVEIKEEPVKNTVIVELDPEVIQDIDEVIEQQVSLDVDEEEETEEVEVVEEEEEATEEVEVVEEEETEEVEEVEVVEEEEEETEEVEVVEEETEEVEEVEVVEEEETEEVEVVEEEEEEEEVVEEETEEEEEEVVEEEEETEEIEVVEEEVEEVEEVEVVEEEEEGVYEIVIKGTRYYTTNETNGTIYAITEDDDIGDEVGKFVNGVAKM